MLGSHEMAGKGYINSKNSQIASTGAILTSTYQLNPWLNSSVSHVVNITVAYLSPGKTKPFKDHPSTHGHLTSLRNKPQ